MRLAGAVREAYLAGWAISGGPFTPRVQAGRDAAVAVALEYRGDPGILEAALQLGHLEGVQAAVRERRERLLRKHLKTVTAAWNACVADLGAASGVAARFRRDIHAMAEAVTADPQRQWWRDTGTAAALTWLNGIYRTEGYDALVAAVEDALLDGMAEGEADALAVAAARQGKAGFAIDGAFAAARERLDGSHLAGEPATAAIAAMITGAANDAGRSLAALAGGAGEDDMTAAVRDAATGDDVRPVRTWTDHALWKAIGAGILGLYGRVSGGLATLTAISVDWVTEADRRVCATCLGNAADGPYPDDEVPPFPGHPLCRCSLETSQRLPLGFLAPFLP